MSNLLQTIRQDGLLRAVIKSSAHLFSGNMAAAALSLFQGILIWHLVGGSGAGLVGIVIVLASNINTLISFRMSETVVRFAAAPLTEGRKEAAAAVVKMCGLLEIAASVAAYIILLLLAPWAARTIADNNPHAATWMMVYGLALLGNLVYETSTGVMRLMRRFDRLAQITFGQSLLTFAVIGWAYFTRQQDVAVILGAYLAGKLFAGVMVAILAWRQADADLGQGWWRVPLQTLSNRREIFTFSVNTNLNGTLNLFTRDMLPLYLGAFRPDVEVGYFRLAQSLIGLMMLPIEPFIWPTYTEITQTIAARQWASTRRLLKQVSLIAAGWVLPAGVGLTLLGAWLIPWVYKPAAAPAYPAAVILAVGYGFATIFQWNRPLLLALGKPAFPVLVAVGVGAVELMLMFTLTPRYGYLAHAAILSGFFIISIGINIGRGLSLLNQQSAIQNQQ